MARPTAREAVRLLEDSGAAGLAASRSSPRVRQGNQAKPASPQAPQSGEEPEQPDLYLEDPEHAPTGEAEEGEPEKNPREGYRPGGPAHRQDDRG